MPERINFTKQSVRDIQPPAKGRRYVYDSKVPALQLQITAAGAKAYYRYGRVKGRPQRIRIGSADTVTPEDARRECLRLSGEIADRKDPVAERRRKRTGITLGELFDWWWEHHSKPHKRTWERDGREFELYLAQWKSRRLADLTPDEIADHHVKLGKDRGRYAANKMRTLLRTIYATAVERGWTQTNPADAVRRFRTDSRERFLSAEELARWFAAVGNLRRETTRDFLLTCLYTGARRDNVQSMRWDELDLTSGLWLIPGRKFKSGQPVAVVLVPQAVEILERRRAASQAEWVFPGQSRRGHITDPSAAWEKVRNEAGIPDVRLHDLRRTLGSWQAAGGSSLSVIGKSLGHRSLSATQVYARLDLDPVRRSVAAAVDAMQAAGQGGNPKDGPEKI